MSKNSLKRIKKWNNWLKICNYNFMFFFVQWRGIDIDVITNNANDAVIYVKIIDWKYATIGCFSLYNDEVLI